jgi:predicted transcriptional regulator
MTDSKKFLPMDANVALISIHPEYAEKIFAGEKRLEFRRVWAAQPVDVLAIYATAPVQRIVGLAWIEHVHHGGKSKLWELGKRYGGGISRRKLFAYLDGRKEAVALAIGQCRRFTEMLDPRLVFDANFKPPQSFRYLRPEEIQQLNNLTEGESWE